MRRINCDIIPDNSHEAEARSLTHAAALVCGSFTQIKPLLLLLLYAGTANSFVGRKMTEIGFIVNNMKKISSGIMGRIAIRLLSHLSHTITVIHDFQPEI